MSVDPSRKHVCLLVPLGVPYIARFLRGVTDYASERGAWTFSLRPTVDGPFHETIGVPLRSLQDWPVDGLIAALTTQRETDEVRRLGIPAINMAGTLRRCEVPRVMVDHRAIGHLAAEHLLECGLKSFAYLGLKDIWYSECRRDGFAQRIAESGGQLNLYEMPRYKDPNKSWQRGLEQIDQCLEEVPRPMGVLAVHDYRARLLVDECHRKGLNVPNDVAIIGVDNDNIVCEFCSPPLSSVSRSGYRTGYETASLLDRLMAGEPSPEQDVLIAPDGVIKRESTGLIVVDHPHVAAAVAYIRDHLDEPFGVERLVRVLPVGRRQLEYLFKKHLKRTPHEYLRHARIDRAKALLSGPQKLGVAEIARQSGFADTHGFLMAFRHVEGKTPTTYRKEVSYR